MIRPMRMLWMVVVPVVLGLGNAEASECASRASIDDFLAQYQEAIGTLRGNDPEAFLLSSEGLAKQFPCLSEAIPPRMLASAYRLVGVRHFRTGDEEGAMRWLRTARQLDPGFEWDIGTLDVDAPERALYAQQQMFAGIDPVGVPGKLLARPPGTRVLLDGVVLKEASATPDRYHLLQVVDNSGPVRSSQVILGNAFPQALLRVPAADEADRIAGQMAASSAPSSAPARQSTVERIQRDRPPFKTPVLALGGAGLAGAAALYGLSYGANQDFLSATKTAQLTAARGSANTYFWASLACLAAGTATASWGVYMSDGMGWAYQGRW
jgi:hypothetical protein